MGTVSVSYDRSARPPPTNPYNNNNSSNNSSSNSNNNNNNATEIQQDTGLLGALLQYGLIGSVVGVAALPAWCSYRRSTFLRAFRLAHKAALPSAEAVLRRSLRSTFITSAGAEKFADSFINATAEVRSQTIRRSARRSWMLALLPLALAQLLLSDNSVSVSRPPPPTAATLT
eukprot:gnl/Hemi2/24231_TR8136_c0_g1_i1.p2 gnl/Hemi2/24231_TR8136_c0_g1~~gnl/Hemi2/24231_TR8136_c0_g1_i1.p2  ORF type:complete len:173 (-),score=43.31 gnl/Hemi2/24231_TR8136_c0_g1_i1:254-772(-)